MKPPKPLPSLDVLFHWFTVDSTSPTGLRWAQRPGLRSARRSGDVAGTLTKDGYGQVVIPGLGGSAWRSARLVNFMKTGCDPLMEVDHKDRNPANNHPFNLRWATRPEQLSNQDRSPKSGYAHVYPRWDGKWRCNIKGKEFSGFATPEEAYQFYLSHSS